MPALVIGAGSGCGMAAEGEGGEVPGIDCDLVERTDLLFLVIVVLGAGVLDTTLSWSSSRVP